MHARRDATDVLDRDFLDARCKILEIAAILDRIDPRRRGMASTPTRGWASSGEGSRHCSSRGPAGQRPSSTFSRSSTISTGAGR